MSSTGRKIIQIKEKFANLSIKTDEDWLNGCVEWFLEEEPGVSVDELFRRAHEQWQLSDLSDSGVGCLPQQIFDNKQCHTVNGKFVLQIQHLIDIAEPAYDQLQKLYEKELDEPLEQEQFRNQTQRFTKKKRVLRLELSDGTSSVTAMEYFPIASLHTKLPPGTKILLKGPVRCVNHILLMESKNISLLGGEVESLTIENAFENMLLKSLNRPINPNPKSDYRESTVTELGSKPSSLIAPNTGNTQMQSSRNAPNTANSQTPISLDDLGDEDYLFSNIDIDELATEAVSAKRTATTIQNTACSENQSKRLRSNSFDKTDETQRNRSAVPQIDAYGDDDDDDLAFIIDDSFDQLVAQSTDAQLLTSNTSSATNILSKEYQFKIRGSNLVTIDQLDNCTRSSKEERRHFMMKAEIQTVFEKIKVARSGWSLGAILTDNLSRKTLRVNFSSEVLSKLSGSTPDEIQEMKQLLKDRPQVQADLTKIVRNLSDRLHTLQMFMKLEYSPDAVNPIVIELIDCSPYLELILQNKIDAER